MDRTPKHINPHLGEKEIKQALGKYYIDKKMDYDAFYNSINYVSPGIHIKHYLSTCLKYVQSGDRWLDVGCGSANELKNVLKHDVELHGMEIVDKSIKKAIENGINCIKNSACDPYPYRDEYFDMITCTDVLEHLTENDAIKAVANIYRILKPNKFSLLAPAVTKDRTGYFHLTIKPRKWWIKLFEDEGFTFIEYIKPKGILLKK